MIKSFKKTYILSDVKSGALKQSSHQLVRVPSHRVGPESQENILIFSAAKIIVIVIVDNLRIQLNTAGNLLQRGYSLLSRKKCGFGAEEFH